MQTTLKNNSLLCFTIFSFLKLLKVLLKQLNDGSFLKIAIKYKMHKISKFFFFFLVISRLLKYDSCFFSLLSFCA